MTRGSNPPGCANLLYQESRKLQYCALPLNWYTALGIIISKAVKSYTSEPSNRFRVLHFRKDNGDKDRATLGRVPYFYSRLIAAFCVENTEREKDMIVKLKSSLNGYYREHCIECSSYDVVYFNNRVEIIVEPGSINSQDPGTVHSLMTKKSFDELKEVNPKGLPHQYWEEAYIENSNGKTINKIKPIH